ncbi:hypothetical protein KY343_03385 [Candidatus Woesearchaeota archaeon]|nr:hypothetical protein [Candidatus Woesearchaeota archaeon]
MKLNYLNITIIICLLILISGCGSSDNDVEEEESFIVEDIDEVQNNSVVIIGSGEARSQNSDSAEETEEEDSNVAVIEYDEETGTNADLVRELMEDLVDQDAITEEEDSTEDEETVDEEREIVIENFRGNPRDIIIEKGTTVKWTNLMYFKHIIIILPERGDGTFENRWINEDLVELWYEESYEFTFEEEGKYQWGSKTKFDVTKGVVTVLD